MAIEILDDRYLAISAIITLVWQLSFWCVASGCKFDKVTDFAYGSNFVGIAVITLILNETYYTRQVILTIFVSIWGVRLAIFLLRRIIAMGKDNRFDNIRNGFFKFAAFWILQFFTIWVCSLPLILVNSDKENKGLIWSDYLGIVMYILGMICEILADEQKNSFRNKKENSGMWCDKGIWYYSRHPNYFGEMLLWWGIFISCASVFQDLEFISIVGPIFISAALLGLSG